MGQIMRTTHLKTVPDNFPDAAHKVRADEYWTLHGRPDLCKRIDDIVSEFRSHHEAKGTRFCNWAAGWKTWYVRAVRYIEPPRSKDVVRDFRTTGRRGRAPYVAPKPEENTVTHKMIHELAEKLRSPEQKRMWK